MSALGPETDTTLSERPAWSDVFATYQRRAAWHTLVVLENEFVAARVEPELLAGSMGRQSV